MIKRGLLVTGVWICGSIVAAQFWAPLRSGIKPPGSVFSVHGDTIWDELLAATSVKWIIEGDDTLLIRGAASWDGLSWDSLPGQLQECASGNGCSPVHRFWRYHGDLYANGHFVFMTPEGVWNNGIARWSEDNARWEALECINTSVNGMSTMMYVPPNDTMYFTGYMGSVCGFPESCVFSYDGDALEPFAPFGDLPGVEGDYVGFVFRFQGRLYMTGLMESALTGDIHGFLRYTGSGWEPVPGFETPAPIKDVLIHDDKLYMCGYFFTATGAPGNMVTMYDGEQWSDLGGGLLYALPSSTSGIALDLHEWNNDIYVAGQYNFAGGVHAENVARWDGTRWCGMGGAYSSFNPGGTVWSVTDWRDELYIAGGFQYIDGDTMNNVARWLGEVENCSLPVGLAEQHAPGYTLLPELVDAEGTWRIEAREPIAEWSVYDPIGRVVLRERSDPAQAVIVDLRGFPPGVYVFQCSTSGGAALRSKLYRP